MTATDLSPRSRPHVQSSRFSLSAGLVLSATLLSCIYLQKFGVPLGGSSLGLIFLVLCGALVALASMGELKLNPLRLALYAGFVLAAVASQLVAIEPPSPTSLLLVLILYLPFVVVVELSTAGYRGYLMQFQRSMLIICVIVVLQQAIQYTVGAGYWPSVDKLFPSSVLLPEFNYMRETGYLSGKYMPNGIFFLEPSMCSQFLAIAIIVELVFFTKVWRLAAFSGALLATTAGSGLFVLALSLPVFGLRYFRRAMPVAVLGVVVVAIVYTTTSWGANIDERLGEFGRPGTSAYIRYVGPVAHSLQGIREDPLRVVRGQGAGTTLNDPMHNNLGTTKLLDEYGVIVTLLFYVFLAISVFGRSPSAALVWAVLVYYLIGGGGLAVPVYVVPLVLLGSLVRLREGEPDPISSSGRRQPARRRASAAESSCAPPGVAVRARPNPGE